MKKTDLDAPSSPHIIVASDRLAIAHKAKVHGRANELSIKSQIHPTHGEQGSLGDGKNSIHIPNKTPHCCRLRLCDKWNPLAVRQ